MDRHFSNEDLAGDVTSVCHAYLNEFFSNVSGETLASTREPGYSIFKLLDDSAGIIYRLLNRSRTNINDGSRTHILSFSQAYFMLSCHVKVTPPVDRYACRETHQSILLAFASKFSNKCPILLEDLHPVVTPVSDHKLPLVVHCNARGIV